MLIKIGSKVWKKWIRVWNGWLREGLISEVEDGLENEKRGRGKSRDWKGKEGWKWNWVDLRKTWTLNERFRILGRHGTILRERRGSIPGIDDLRVSLDNKEFYLKRNKLENMDKLSTWWMGIAFLNFKILWLTDKHILSNLRESVNI